VVGAGPHRLAARGQGTILFPRQIHRFTAPSRKPSSPTWRTGPPSPHRATTENPFFEVNVPLGALFHALPAGGLSTATPGPHRRP